MRRHKRHAAASPTPTATPPRRRPRVGDRVLLRRSDTYLAERHGAAPGSVGTVVEHSRLGRDDDGVLIDWGRGGRVRSNLDEVTVTEPGEHLLVEKPRYARAVLYDGNNLLDVRALAGDIPEPPIGRWVTISADGELQILTAPECEARYDRTEGATHG